MTKAKLGSIGLSFLVLALLVVWMATGDVKEALEAKDRTRCAAVAPPDGLYFLRAEYGDAS